MPRKQASLKEFRQGLSKILDGLLEGDEVVITDYRKKVAVFRKETDMHKLAFFNHAGGSGKTCSVRDIGYTLAQMGKKVLLIDMDPQASLTTWLGFVDVALEETLYLTLTQKAPLPTPKEVSGMHLIPSHLNLSMLDTELLAGGGANIHRMRIALKQIQGYDFVLIDLPPALAAITTSVTTAVDHLVVTVPAAPKGLDGLMTIQTMVEKYQEVNDNLEVLMYVINRFDGRVNSANDVVRTLRQAVPGLVSTPIKERKAVFDQAQMAGVPAPEYQPAGPAADEIRAVTEQLLMRLAGKKLTFERLADTLGRAPTGELFAEIMGIRLKPGQQEQYRVPLTEASRQELLELIK